MLEIKIITNAGNETKKPMRTSLKIFLLSDFAMRKIIDIKDDIDEASAIPLCFRGSTKIRQKTAFTRKAIIPDITGILSCPDAWKSVINILEIATDISPTEYITRASAVPITSSNPNFPYPKTKYIIGFENKINPAVAGMTMAVEKKIALEKLSFLDFPPSAIKGKDT